MTGIFLRGFQRKRWLLLLPALLCLVSVHLFPNQVLTWVDQKLFDLVISLRGKPVPAHPAVVVAKDPVFRERFGRDPNRADMARTLEILASAGVGVAALDFIYDDAQTPENDQALRNAFARVPAAIVAERFSARTSFSGVESFAWRPTSGRPPVPAGLYQPVVDTTRDRGLINVFLGSDEMIRVMPLAFLPEGTSDYRPSLGFAAWMQWLLQRAPKPDLKERAADVAPSAVAVRKVFESAPHRFCGVGHPGLDRLLRHREVAWLARHCAQAGTTISAAAASGASASSTPARDAGPLETHQTNEASLASWTSAALTALAEGLPARTWLSLPPAPLPIIGPEEAPCLRLPLTKLQPPLIGDGIRTLSMGALLPSDSDADASLAATRRATLEVGPSASGAVQEIPLGFSFEEPGSERINGSAIDFTGIPLKGVRALCRRLDGSFWASAETDAQGKYEFSRLPAGTYSVELQWTNGATFQRLNLEMPVGSRDQPTLPPARFFPLDGGLVASFPAVAYERDLLLSGEGLWVADSGPNGELPWATPPVGLSLQFLDGETQGTWASSGCLLGSASQPLFHTRIALLEEPAVWKASWELRHRIPAGAVEVRVGGVPPSLGARALLVRNSSADGEAKAVDIDLPAGACTRIASMPAETESDERLARLTLSGGTAVAPGELLLIGPRGEWMVASAPLSELSLHSGKWRVFAKRGERRGTYDSLRALVGGKAIFVGTRLPEDQDFRICPLNFWDSSFPSIPGVNLHAHLFSALARDEVLRPTIFHYDRFPRAWPLTCLLLLLPLLILCDEVFARRGALWGGFAVGATACGWLGTSLWLYASNLLLPVSLPLACFGLFGFSRGYLAYAQARQRERETRTTFGRFVSARMVDEILRNPNALKPGGEKKQLTVMFTDLAGFTSISEKLSPEELTALMNEYLGEMTRILFVHGGTLDKYIGDAIMGFWNHPADQPDHALRAVRCAIEMQHRLVEMREQWLARGLPEVSMRAGINTSEAVVGFIGSDVQMNFTCLGDGVNLASRLEGANKAYHTLMMMSESTRNSLPSGVVRSRLLDFLAVKGKEQPIKVYEIIGEPGHEDALWEKVVPLYEAGIAAYLARRWDEAESRFREILTLRPDDGPSLTYLERCTAFRESPPPEGWDGRYILKTK